MTLPRSVADVVSRHVLFEIESIDRMYCNLYVPQLLGPVTARDQSLVVAWSLSALTGGDPLAGYTLSATAGSQAVTIHPGPAATKAVIPGLADGTTYQVSLSAHSTAGTSASVHGSGTPSPPYSPGQPLNLQVTPTASGGLAVSWQAPVNNGGDAITDY